MNTLCSPFATVGSVWHMFNRHSRRDAQLLWENIRVIALPWRIPSWILAWIYSSYTTTSPGWGIVDQMATLASYPDGKNSADSARWNWAMCFSRSRRYWVVPSRIREDRLPISKSGCWASSSRKAWRSAPEEASESVSLEPKSTIWPVFCGFAGSINLPFWWRFSRAAWHFLVRASPECPDVRWKEQCTVFEVPRLLCDTEHSLALWSDGTVLRRSVKGRLTDMLA